MNYKELQMQYDKIYSFFYTTTEPFDLLEWNGRELSVWNKDKINERYTLNDLKTMKIIL